MRSVLRYEIDKVTVGLTAVLDRDIHGLSVQLEATKYNVSKYCIGTLVSISAIGLAVIQIIL